MKYEVLDDKVWVGCEYFNNGSAYIALAQIGDKTLLLRRSDQEVVIASGMKKYLVTHDDDTKEITNMWDHGTYLGAYMNQVLSNLINPEDTTEARYKTLLYNSIVLLEEESYEKETILKELGITEKEYNDVMEASK